MTPFDGKCQTRTDVIFYIFDFAMMRRVVLKVTDRHRYIHRCGQGHGMALDKITDLSKISAYSA